MKGVIGPPMAQQWIKAFESAEKTVEAMRSLVKKNKVLLDRNKRLRDELKRLTKRSWAHSLRSSSA
jgi:hypothetical protein